MQVTEGEIRPPDIWRHDRSGELSCGYENGETVFSWPPEAVAEMASRWRNSAASRSSKRARTFRETYERLEALIEEAGLRAPDTVMFHLGRGELRGAWEKEKIVLEVEGIPTNGSAARAVRRRPMSC